MLTIFLCYLFCFLLRERLKRDTTFFPLHFLYVPRLQYEVGVLNLMCEWTMKLMCWCNVVSMWTDCQTENYQCVNWPSNWCVHRPNWAVNRLPNWCVNRPPNWCVSKIDSVWVDCQTEVCRIWSDLCLLIGFELKVSVVCVTLSLCVVLDRQSWATQSCNKGLLKRWLTTSHVLAADTGSRAWQSLVNPILVWKYQMSFFFFSFLFTWFYLGGHNSSLWPSAKESVAYLPPPPHVFCNSAEASSISSPLSERTSFSGLPGAVCPCVSFSIGPIP